MQAISVLEPLEVVIGVGVDQEIDDRALVGVDGSVEVRPELETKVRDLVDLGGRTPHRLQVLGHTLGSVLDKGGQVSDQGIVLAVDLLVSVSCALSQTSVGVDGEGVEVTLGVRRSVQV